MSTGVPMRILLESIRLLAATHRTIECCSSVCCGHCADTRLRLDSDRGELTAALQEKHHDLDLDKCASGTYTWVKERRSRTDAPYVEDSSSVFITFIIIIKK